MYKAIVYIYKVLMDLRKWLFFLFDTVLIRFIRRGANKDSVLIVRLDAIGDFVIFLDSAKGLRELYPEKKYRLTLLGNSSWIELARELPYWDEVWAIDRKKFTENPYYRWRIMSKVRKAGFETAIEPTYSREFDLGDSIIHLSGAVHRIGWAGDFGNIKPGHKAVSDHWYSELLKNPDSGLTELEINAEFIRRLGLNDFEANIPELTINKSGADLHIDNYYVLFPGAGFETKQWPLSNFKEI
jgi:ADP-heptose:LPS heptosyltransferase